MCSLSAPLLDNKFQCDSTEILDICWLCAYIWVQHIFIWCCVKTAGRKMRRLIFIQYYYMKTELGRITKMYRCEPVFCLIHMIRIYSFCCLHFIFVFCIVALPSTSVFLLVRRAAHKHSKYCSEILIELRQPQTMLFQPLVIKLLKLPNW